MAGNTKRETQSAGILHELADIKAEVQRMEARANQIATETKNLQSHVSLLCSSSPGIFELEFDFSTPIDGIIARLIRIQESLPLSIKTISLV